MKAQIATLKILNQVEIKNQMIAVFSYHNAKK